MLTLANALAQLSRHRTRSALALVGIILATSSLVLLVGLLQGGEAALLAAAQDANEKDLIVVHEAAPPLPQQRRIAPPLALSDALALARAPGLEGARVSMEQRAATSARRGGRSKRVTVASAGPATGAIYRLKLARGRFLTELDTDSAAQVCVLGREVWQELFAGGLALGERVVIDEAPCTVVGVLENKPIVGGTSDTDIWNRKVLLPETTFDALYNPRHRADKLVIRPDSGWGPRPLEPLRVVARGLLLRLHHGVENFKLNPARGAAQEELVAGILYVLLLAAVGLSLFVGGINVMNVLLVSVTERAREIGIRRTLGASPRTIRWQFLTEAMLLTGVGGLLGVVAGSAGCGVMALVLRNVVGAWQLIIEPWSVALGFGMSLLIGLVFGTYPATRAARLVIVEALRRE